MAQQQPAVSTKPVETPKTKPQFPLPPQGRPAPIFTDYAAI
ncbi:MAG: hypothetical protein R6V30_08525 [Paracoccaceae bacterium]